MSKVRELLGLGPDEHPSIGHVEGLLGLMDVVEAEKDDQIAALVEALKRFSLWLEQECTRGTLDLGFGPDWSARKVELALDRLLADLPAAARERAEERERLAAEAEDADEEIGRLRGLLTDEWLERIASTDPDIEHAHLADVEIRRRAALAGEKAE